MNERYRVDRSITGGYTVRQTDAAEDIVTGAMGAVGWVAGSIIGGSARGIATLARNSRDRRIVEAVEAMTQAAELEKFDHLLKIATAFAQQYKKEPAGSAFLGVALAGLGRYDEAITSINRAQQLGLDPLEAVMLRASTYREKRDVAQMLREYTILTQHAETRQDGYLGRAQALTELGDYEQALNDANQGIAVAPNELGYFVRAEVYRAHGNAQKAIEDYTRAIRLAPRESALLERRATLYEESGMASEALADRDEAQRVNSGEYDLVEARQLLNYLRSGGVKLKIARNGRDLEPSGTKLKPETLDKIKRFKPQLLQILTSE